MKGFALVSPHHGFGKCFSQKSETKRFYFKYSFLKDSYIFHKYCIVIAFSIDTNFAIQIIYLLPLLVEILRNNTHMTIVFISSMPR